MNLTLERIFFKSVSNAPLVIFRVLFGLLITIEAWGAIATGWVKEVFIDSKYSFPFIDFDFLKPLPGNGMYYYFILMGIFGAMVMLGFYYRLAIICYTIMWTVVYLMQKVHYNNHYYLLVLLCLIMCFLPANKKFSLDVKRNPDTRSDSCPNWCLLIFIIQVSIVYTYAAIAKMNLDWLSGETMSLMMSYKKSYFLIGELLQQKWLQWFLTIGGVLFDLLIAPLLLWRKTRLVSFFVLVFFHLFNSLVFQIGIFPYMGIALTIFFFPAEEVQKFFFRKEIPLIAKDHFYPKNKVIIAAIIIWTAIQFLLPLRHWLYEGDVNLTEEGHRLSWRMMLRLKHGSVSFVVMDKDQNTGERVDFDRYIHPRNRILVATRPDICWQFIQLVKKDYEMRGKKNIAIYANSWVRLNGGPRKPFYKPGYNLAEAKWERFKESEWVLR